MAFHYIKFDHLPECGSSSGQLCQARNAKIKILNITATVRFVRSVSEFEFQLEILYLFSF